MPRTVRKHFYEKKDNYSLYALINKKDKSFFVGYCKTSNLDNNYRRHMCGDSYKTESWINQMKIQNERPCYFVLDNLYETKPNTFACLVVWIKILVENNYIAINKGSIIEYSNDLNEENYEYYMLNKNKIDELVDCDNCKKTIYKKEVCIFCKKAKINNNKRIKKKKTSNKKRIQLRVNDEEYRMIVANAKRRKMNMADYMRKVSMEGRTFTIDYSYLKDIISTVKDTSRFINSFIVTTLYTGEYFPSDLERIINELKDINRMQKEVLGQLEKEKYKLLEQIENEILKVDNK